MEQPAGILRIKNMRPLQAETASKKLPSYLLHREREGRLGTEGSAGSSDGHLILAHAGAGIWVPATTTTTRTATAARKGRAQHHQ